MVILLILFISFNSPLLFAQKIPSSSELVERAWEAKGKGDYKKVYEIVEECIRLYGEEADKIAQKLSDFPPKGKENVYKVMNDVATCLFVKGEALVAEGKLEEAKKLFKELIEKYPYAQAWDPRGWFWSIAEKSKITLNKLEKGVIEEEEEVIGKITKIKLWDKGTERVVRYTKYGKFIGEGTQDYQYKILDLKGLRKAVGEGIYPNINSFKKDPEFEKVKNTEEFKKFTHWEIVNTRDLKTAFYKWCLAPEPEGVKQFYIASLLERSGLYNHAIKAYYACVVHFPRSYGWTYWHTPWYIAPSSICRIKYLIKRHPELGLEYEGADVKIIGRFDNDVSNDVFIVKPGRLKRKKFSIFKKLKKILPFGKKRRLGKIKQKRGGERISLVQYESGDWQLLVDGKPFIVKGITYAPTRVGESPDNGSIKNWMYYDYNHNGVIDCLEVWVDKNNNNIRDEDEPLTSDFKLLKDLGVNTIRIYHHPLGVNKELLRYLYKKYGIFVIMGDFLGKYALGSGASWREGTDYDNPQHQENMINSVKKMVEEFKDEPYILCWMLGNENVYGVACNADKKPASFFKFANKVARIIKKIDPHHPVMLCSGDVLYLDLFGKYCKDIDIFGTNAYRGKYGFGFLWRDVKECADKPVIITEFGAPAYGKGYTSEEAQDFQAEYLKSNWEDIMENSCGYGEGNALGGIVFEFLDEWWKAYEPYYHDKKGLFTGPFLDGYMHEEWLGIVGQGNGKNSPYQRVLRKAYFVLKKLWKK